jgi:hypothetical protein
LWSCNPDLSFRIDRFRLIRFRSPLLSESRLFSFPSGTEMVHFPEFARSPYTFLRMLSDERNRCSHRLGFPIRKSPDHRLLASSRSLSQLTTSFIASLRQGIHTHTLSSLTIKSISNTKLFNEILCCAACFPAGQTRTSVLQAALLVVSNARQIFNFQRSDFLDFYPFQGFCRKRRKSISSSLVMQDIHLQFLRLGGGGPG